VAGSGDVGSGGVGTVLRWYASAQRDLPWRSPDTSPWGVLVSEVMLQQTPVSRVLPAYEAWLARWPTPAACAAAPAGEAVRQWGRLGYPRRALRLHAAATEIVQRHSGTVPRDPESLRCLPGVGAYTAAAVAAFAFGARVAVVDTNVRRVLARAVSGRADAGPPSEARDLHAAEALLPADPAAAAAWSVAVMELGALVCTARAPRCGECPVAGCCAWRAAGCPPPQGPAPRGQTFAGTDRQVRGRLLELLRSSAEPLPAEALDPAWDEPVQRARALAGLVADGLVDERPDRSYALPGC
jgi:A/G-specific adenine glycosylase